MPLPPRPQYPLSARPDYAVGEYSEPRFHRRDDPAEILRKLRRHRKLLFASLVAFTALGLFTVTQMEPRYSAYAEVLVGVPEPKVLKAESVLRGMAPDAEVLRTEARVLASPVVAKAVIEELALDKNPEFNPELRDPSSWSRLTAPIYAGLSAFWKGITDTVEDRPAAAPVPEMNRTEQRIVNILLSKIEVQPFARSFVLGIQADASDPRVAADIANGFANAYTEYQKTQKRGVTSNAEQYLKERIDTLRGEVAKSDQAVEDYRRKTGLFQGANAGVTAQQMTELNTQLVLAQAAKAEAESRLAQAQETAKRADRRDTIPEVLRSPSIQALKQQQIEVERKVAELASTYGPRHPRMRNAQAEIEEVRQKVRLEVQRTVAGLRNEAGAAAARYEAIRDNFEKLKAEMGAANENSIELQALEREAEANRTMLESMLTRYKETVAQDDLVTSDVQVIAPASVPESPSFPPRTLLIVLSAFGGLAIGVMLALLVEHFDKTFRRAKEVEEATGMPVLALVPSLRRNGKPANQVLDKPVSPYSDALRRLHIATQYADASQLTRLVMFASATPGESKSSLCASLARLVAASGRRVILIDCDWRRPSQHRYFGGRNVRGLAQVLSDTLSLNEAIFEDTASGAHVLFAGSSRPADLHILNSDRMRHLLLELANAYDLVILDTPPVLVGAEVLHLARLVDKVVFTVRWGYTPQEVAVDALKQIVEAHGDVAGVVLSRVDPERYRYYSYTKLDYRYSKPVLASFRRA